MEVQHIVVLALISVAGTGTCFTLRDNKADVKFKILGGESISIEEAPYQVYLTFATQVACEGALIKPDIVLTAAHCVENVNDFKDIYPMFVVAGTDNANLSSKIADGRMRISARSIQLYPEYDQNSLVKSLKYDLAIIQLEKPFQLSEKIQTIDLPKRDVNNNEELLITGAGMVDKKEEQPSKYLKGYKPKVTSCRNKVWYRGMKNYNGIICHWSEMGYKTLVGDSGSPIVNSDKQLAGIQSGTFEDFQVGINVYYFLEWICMWVQHFHHSSLHDCHIHNVVSIL